MRTTHRARLRYGHPDSPKRRIDVECIRRNAIAHPTLLTVQQVRGHDLEIVVRGVRERPAAITIAESPDAGHIRCEALVDGYVAACIGRDACAVETKVFCVRAAPDSEKHMRRDHLRLSGLAIDRHCHSFRPLPETDALGFGPHPYPLLGENRPNGVGNVHVLTSDQAWTLLNDRDVGAKAPVHLREFEPNVAAANDHEMLRYQVERKDRAVREVRDFADARHLGHRGAAADVDEDAWCSELLFADPDRVRALETGMALDHCAAGHAAQPLLDTGTRVGGDSVGPRPYARHVDFDGTVEDHAILAAPTSEM